MAQVVQMGKVLRFVTELLGPVMHLKRARSIGFAVFGAMRARRLSSADLGTALAAYRGKSAKHGIKQVDRLLGNAKFDVRPVFEAYVPWIVGSRQEIVVSLDWTEYAADGHSRIAINLVTSHGRATPLVWMSVESTSLKDSRNDYEDELLELLSEILPKGINVVLLADRGFGDEKLYRHLQEDLHWDFVIRFRGAIHVESQDGEKMRARDWVPPNGRIREITDALVTHKKTQVGAVVVVKKAGMKEAWHLATSFRDQRNFVVHLYSRRFTCEENFRDEKDDRFGLGFKETRVSTCERRDRFLVINSLATVLLTLLGASVEILGLDRHSKSNTASRRIHSLFRQGRQIIQGFIRDHVTALQRLLWKLLSMQRSTTEVFGLI